MKTFKELFEKKLTPAEMKKREEIAKAMERENPGMDMGKKMAIATAAAKRVAEEVELDEALSSSDRSKQMFKRKELDHELRHEVEPKRAEPADPYAVHINGKKWKTFPTKSHATNVAKKITGATVVKESEELDEVNVMNRTSPVRRSNYVHPDKSDTPGKDSGTHNVVDAAGKVVASYKNKMAAIDHANKKDEYRVKSIYEEVEIDEAAGHTIEAHGIRGMKGTPWRKTFKSHDHLSDWADKNDSVEVHGTRDLENTKTKQPTNEAVDHHAEAMEHKKKADAAMDKNDMEAYHHHMSAHHESMGQWHESKGRSSSADKEFEKAEKHHELSLKKSNQKNEGTEMLSFKYFQQELAEAKQKAKESSAQIELAHGDMLDKDEENGKEKKEMCVKEGQAPVAPVPGTKSKTHAIMVHPESKQRITIERKNMKNYPASEGWKEVAPGMKLKEEVEELDEAAITHVVAKDKLAAHKEFMGKEGFDVTTKPLPKSHPKHATHVGIVSKNSQESSYHEDGNAHSVSESVELDEGDELNMRHKFVFNKTPAGKAREVARNREELKMQMKRTKEMGGITGPKGKLPEEVEIDEALKGDMHPDAGKVLKHIKPEHHDKYKPHLKSGVYKGNYADRAAVLGAAEKAGHTITEAVSPFDWKAYAKAKGPDSSKKTKTFHDVKKTSTGTVYTKQVNPDGMSKGSGEDAAQAAEKADAPKRGRGRPAGVGAKTGSYKPRDPAAKAASAAKAAASKAANRAMRKESFDEEFMSSLIEGFEDEDFDDFLYCEEFDELDEATQEALINFINEKCASKMKESLTGNQHKLDKNKNGKIDSHDFKLLRKEETEQIQESVTSYAAFLNKK